MAEGFSQRAAARYLGVSAPTIGRGIKRGRLKKSVRVAPDGAVVITDLALARQEWEVSRDLTTAPVAVLERVTPGVTADVTPQAPSIAAAAASERQWKAKLAELEYNRRSGELVPLAAVVEWKADIERQRMEIYTRIRTRILGTPIELKHAEPAVEDRALRTLAQLLREALTELSEL